MCSGNVEPGPDCAEWSTIMQDPATMQEMVHLSVLQQRHRMQLILPLHRGVGQDLVLGMGK